MCLAIFGPLEAVVLPATHISAQADVATLDFGLVACGFSHECVFSLLNTSVVPAHFSWRALGTPASTAAQHELQVGAPVVSGLHCSYTQAGSLHWRTGVAGGTLGGRAACSGRAANCCYPNPGAPRLSAGLALQLDLPGLADALLVLPARASVGAPDLALDAPAIAWGECFTGCAHQPETRMELLAQVNPFSFGGGWLC